MSVARARFLGIDLSGDLVWELPDGRWTWGPTEEFALANKRTLEPDRYVEKYGEPRAEEDL